MADVGRECIGVCHLITELNVGGAERTLARLLARLDRERFTPVVSCLYDGDGAVGEEIRALGIPVLDLRMTAKWRLSAFWRLYRLLRSERPAIMHTWMFHANIPGRILGRLAGVPIIVSSERTMGMESRWRYWTNRLTDPLTDRVVCVSQRVAEFVVQHVGVPEEKTVVIPNGVDTERFAHLPNKPQARTRLGLHPEAVWVGTVARLDAVKRLDLFLRALAELPDVHAVIVGDGPERAGLSALAGQLGVAERVVFAGHQTDVRTWLAAMDLFVLPSDWEGMSNALLEAMAAGLTVVATAVGGTPEVVVDRVTGLLVPPRDPQTLADAILRLLRDPDLRKQMGKAGRERVVEHFSVERMVERTEALYEQLLARKGLARK